MNKIYDIQSRPLHELLSSAGANARDGAELLIPDLQRPYVWDPNQVVLLVDSILRGWPFGTLLLWRISNAEHAKIPFRSFWNVVDRTQDEKGEKQPVATPPAEFRLVLDGQQRIQSLLLAFYGRGFKLTNAQWNSELLDGDSRSKGSRKDWCLGTLCLDLDEFVVRASESAAWVNYRDVLRWVVLDPRRRGDL